MKQFITGIIVFFCISCASIHSSKTDFLNGVWKPVQEEIGGNALPKESFATQSLIIKDSNYIFTAESVDKGVVKYAAGKMDIYGREGVNKGKHFTTIYKLDNGLFYVCYNLAGTNYPESFDTKGKPLYFLCVYKKS